MQCSTLCAANVAGKKDEMIIAGIADREDESVDYPVMRCEPSGAMTAIDEPLQEENILQIDIDGSCAMRTRCSANRLEELVVGRLVTTGEISSMDEIESIAIGEDPLRADVRLRRNGPTTRFDTETPPSGDEGLAFEGFLAQAQHLAPLKPIPWTLDEVFAEARIFAEDRTSHKKTRGTHSAYLFRKGDLLFCREDIGRHNAFDKIVGAALLNGVDLQECTLFTSGRVPTDMAIKAVRARIPLVISKAVPTVDTVEMARACNLTLICKATVASVDVVNDPLHIVSPA